MSVLIHCDGPDCDQTALPDSPVIENMAGDVVLGWSTLSTGWHTWNFHNLGCLAAFAAARLDKRAAEGLKGRETGTSQGSGGV